jgi:uncharacterized protein YjbI with pentapeptide repeats
MGANLGGTTLDHVNLDGTDLRWAELGRADLSDARSLTQEQISEAKGDSTTKLPAFMDRPDSWKK